MLGTFEVAGSSEKVSKLIPTVGVIGIEIGRFAVGGKRLGGIMQKGVCPDVPSSGSSFVQRFSPL